jgi:AcrR family transcriptional regulator
VERGNGKDGRQPLTRERICEAALEAIDRDGLDCLSMRSLAQSLGIKASSLYYHFPSKEALLTGVAESVYTKLQQWPDNGGWQDRIREAFLELRRFIESHPNAAPLLTRDLPYSPVARERAADLMSVLCRSGHDVGASATLIGNLVAFLVGHSLLAVWLEEEARVRLVPDHNNGDGDGRYSWLGEVLHFTPVSADGTTFDSDADLQMHLLKSGDISKTFAHDSFAAGLDALIQGLVKP